MNIPARLIHDTAPGYSQWQLIAELPDEDVVLKRFGDEDEAEKDLAKIEKDAQ